MSWIATGNGVRRHLFPGLGTVALCGITRSVTAPGTANSSAPTCERCTGVVEARRAYWQTPVAQRGAYPG